MVEIIQLPDVPEIRHLEVVLMPNGEVICLGKTIGYVDELNKFLTNPNPKK